MIYFVLNKQGLVLSKGSVAGYWHGYYFLEYDARTAVQFPSLLAAEKGSLIYGGVPGMLTTTPVIPQAAIERAGALAAGVAPPRLQLLKGGK